MNFYILSQGGGGGVSINAKLLCVNVVIVGCFLVHVVKNKKKWCMNIYIYMHFDIVFI
jgi:hypothetical protein